MAKSERMDPRVEMLPTYFLSGPPASETAPELDPESDTLASWSGGDPELEPVLDAAPELDPDPELDFDPELEPPEPEPEPELAPELELTWSIDESLLDPELDSPPLGSDDALHAAAAAATKGTSATRRERACMGNPRSVSSRLGGTRRLIR
jgi:hypothetical protein